MVGKISVVRWQGSSGRSGYSVACEHEWEQGICQAGLSVECPHKNLNLDFNAVYDHLSGKHVAGLYPLLLTSTCYLLAVDFDKEDWRTDVRALAQVCRDEGIPYLVEISRSVWVHIYGSSFRTPFRLGREALRFKLLDKAMERHRACLFILMTVYSPIRSTMPDGGLAV